MANASQWSTLTSIATLGTNRGAPALERIWPTNELVMPANLPPERALLRAAAASFLWQLAGARIAAREPPALERAPSVESPQVSEVAAWRLARMFSGDHRDLVPEWFSLAARAGAVLPPHWLPVALSALQPGERVAAAPVLGARAQWLAQQNPEWAEVMTATGGLPIDRWNNGTLPQRRAALATMRGVDPTGARIWLERSWQTEPPDARVAFLETLLQSPGLSDADEAFLEGALNDKRKEARNAAMECLCRLPRSAHAARNLERLRPLLVLTEVEKGLLSRFKSRKLEVTLPESLDKAAVRDGINAKPPAQQKIGERAYWLMQMVAMAPPAHWCERFQCDINTFMQSVLACDFSQELITALSHASIRHSDSEWITPLSMELLKWFSQPERLAAASQLLPALVSAVPPGAARDALLQKLFTAGGTAQLELLEPALTATDWSAETTRLVFNLLDKRVQADTAQYSHSRQALVRWGMRAETAAAHEEIARLIGHCADKSPWKNALEALQDIIEFRLAMKQELLT